MTLQEQMPPNVGVSRAAGRRDQEKRWHELALKSRAQVAAAPAASGCTPCWAAWNKIYRIGVRYKQV